MRRRAVGSIPRFCVFVWVDAMRIGPNAIFIFVLTFIVNQLKTHHLFEERAIL